ncbi:MAG: hypothetical protein WBY47_03360 [Desulfobacterales bacterium]|jgi:hypothetical protein
MVIPVVSMVGVDKQKAKTVPFGWMQGLCAITLFYKDEFGRADSQTGKICRFLPLKQKIGVKLKE